MSQEHHCLFNFGQADTGMDAVEMFDSRMILQLSDASSKNPFHKAILGRAAVNAGKRQKIQMFSSLENPEAALAKRIKEDKEMEKARMMREAKSRRIREGGHSSRMTKNYLEEGMDDGDDDDVVGEDDSLDAIKAGYGAGAGKKKKSRKKKKAKAKGGRNSDSEDDAENDDVADEEDNAFIDDSDADEDEGENDDGDDDDDDDEDEDEDDAAGNDDNADSDEDDDSEVDEDELAALKAEAGEDVGDGESKSSKRSRVVADSDEDDDEEGDAAQSAPKKRSKAVISDDDDDDDE